MMTSGGHTVKFSPGRHTITQIWVAGLALSHSATSVLSLQLAWLREIRVTQHGVKTFDFLL